MMQNPHYDDSLNKGPKGDKGDPGPSGTFTTPTADVSFGNFKITNLGTPRDGTDAVNKNYTDSRYIRAGENINLGSNLISTSSLPAADNDLANKKYVDRLKIKLFSLNISSKTVKHTSTSGLSFNYLSPPHQTGYKYFLIVFAYIIVSENPLQKVFKGTASIPQVMFSTVYLQFEGVEFEIIFNAENFKVIPCLWGATKAKIIINNMIGLAY